MEGFNKVIEKPNLLFIPYSDEYKDMVQDFDCGNESINKFLTNIKSYEYPKGYVVHLVIDKNKDKVVSYYALSATSLVTKIDGNFRGTPAIEIKMFALDKNYQGIKFIDEDEENAMSDDILLTIVFIIEKWSEDKLGIDFILLHAVPNAMNFWKRNHFKPLNEILNTVHFYDSFTNECHLLARRI